MIFLFDIYLIIPASVHDVIYGLVSSFLDFLLVKGCKSKSSIIFQSFVYEKKTIRFHWRGADNYLMS